MTIEEIAQEDVQTCRYHHPGPEMPTADEYNKDEALWQYIFDDYHRRGIYFTPQTRKEYRTTWIEAVRAYRAKWHEY